jgi:hypothetical protein
MPAEGESDPGSTTEDIGLIFDEDEMPRDMGMGWR